MRTLAAAALSAACLAIAPALAADNVTVVSEAGAFKDAFCAADRAGEHVFVVPTAVFTAGGTVDCADGTYTLRVTEPADDPGHMVMNVDPPHGVASAFDCDGKADTGMTIAAINCIPVSAEAADHKKT